MSATRQLSRASRVCGSPCCASSSRLVLPSATQALASPPRNINPSRPLSLLAHRPPGFFTPPPTPNPDKPPSLEDEVDDREWEMRVARGMLHLRETLPLLFDPEARDLFPAEIYSKNVTLKLPAPLPFKVSSLHGYTMAFTIARNGMQALHTDLKTSLERMSVSPIPPTSTGTAHAPPPARQRQIRILLTLHGRPRLPPHNEATWHTSSLYSFSPYSGLIAHHEVETIRPLPGEGVTEWLRQSLFGFAGRKPEVVDEPAVYPRASSSREECGGADGVVRTKRDE